jgi:hypothetical protein
MAERCAACDGEVGEDAARCPSCGLAFGGGTDSPVLGTPRAPQHVELFFGSAPRAEIAGSADAVPAAETPLTPPRPPKRLGKPTVVAVVVAAAVVAGVVALIRAHRPRDGWTAEEMYFEQFLGAKELQPVEIAADADPEAVLAELGRRDPATLTGAKATHVAFAPSPGESVHEIFESFLARFLDLAPRSSYRLGVHPHPRELHGDDAAGDARRMLLVSDLTRALRALPEAELSPHDRADRAALLGWAQSFLETRDAADVRLLQTMRGCVDSLPRLAEIPCCAVTDRCDAASVVVEAVPELLASCAARLESPPWALVMSTARALDDASASLVGFERAFSGAAPEARRRLSAAVVAAQPALTQAAAALRRRPGARTTGPIGIGPHDAAVVLRVRHRLPEDVRDVYGHALDELRDAHDDMRRLYAAAKASDEPGAATADEAQIAALRDSCRDWLPSMPPDVGVTVRPMPDLDAHRWNAASYVDPGVLLPAAAGVVFVRPERSTDSDFTNRFSVVSRRHLIAHETYPGHRLEAVLRRSACRLRAFVDDRVFIEGWAVYAEDLVHETRHCATGPLDDYVRAGRRADHAIEAIRSILVETGAADLAHVFVSLRATRGKPPEEADVGEIESPTLYPLDYMVGADEIRRLRAFEEKRLGSAFDLRAFHARLLAEGPIPPRLIEEEWREETR